MSLVNEGTVTVGTAYTGVLPNRNGKRLDYVITNTSAGTISLSRGASAIAGQGIILGIGQSWCESNDGSNILCYQGTISLVGSGAGLTVAYSERVQE